MKKRLRKKLRIGEFKDYGFEVELTFHTLPYGSDVDFLHDLFIQIIEECGLRFGGSISEYGVSGYVYKANRITCTDKDRDLLFEKLSSVPPVAYLVVGELQAN